MAKNSEFSFEDEWEVDESSGLITGYIGTVDEAYFFTDPQYNNGQALLMGFVIDLDSAEPSDPDDEATADRLEGMATNEDELRERYSVGDGWDTSDGGETAEHPTKSMVHSSSQYGRVIQAVQGKIEGYGANATCTSEFDLDDMAFDGLIDELKSRGVSPLSAAAWVGLRFRFEEVTIDYGINKKTGEAMIARRNFPVAYLGVDDGEEADEKPAAKKAAKKTTKKASKKKAKAKTDEAEEVEEAEAEAEADSDEGGLDKATFDAMVALAANCEDFDEFTNAVLSDDDLVGNEAALEDISSEDDSATWAKACEDAE